MPILSNMEIRLSLVKSTDLILSPVPLRPTIKPYPTNWLSRTPSKSAISLILELPKAGEQYSPARRKHIAKAAVFIGFRYVITNLPLKLTHKLTTKYAINVPIFQKAERNFDVL